MVEANTTRESRQHRLHKIVTALTRELHFVVFRLKLKIYILRVRPVKRMLCVNFEHLRTQFRVGKSAKVGKRLGSGEHFQKTFATKTW